MELTPALLDEYLVVLRKHNARAAKIGEFMIELNPLPEPEAGLLDVAPQVAGAWKRPADLDARMPLSGLGDG